jgi:hypothetical protein
MKLFSETIDRDAKLVKEVLDSSILRVEGSAMHFEPGSAEEPLFSPLELYITMSGLVSAWPVPVAQPGTADGSEGGFSRKKCNI